MPFYQWFRKKQVRRSAELLRKDAKDLEEKKITDHETEVVDDSQKSPLSHSELKEIVSALQKSEKTSELLNKAFSNAKAREELKEEIIKAKPSLVNSEEKIEYAVQQICGLGFLENILKDKTVTDIGYDGTKLFVVTNQAMKICKPDFVPVSDIIKVISRISATMGREFTEKSSIVDAQLGYLRLNAVHKTRTVGGPTFAIRTTLPKMVLTKKNFNNRNDKTTFADDYMYDFFKACVHANCNIVLSGKTGSGKTEFFKLLGSLIHNDEIIGVIEGEPESHFKELNPDKVVFSYITGKDKTQTDFIRACLRDNVDWILITEVRGGDANEMMQAVLSGHGVILTLHARQAKTIPNRLVNMIQMDYKNINEQALLNNIYDNFQIGCQLRYTKVNGYKVRYLSEVVEFNPDGTSTTLYRRWKKDGIFHSQIVNQPSERLLEQMEEYDVDFPGLGIINEAEPIPRYL